MMRIHYLAILLLLFIACSNESGKKSYTGILEGTSVQVPALTGGKINELLVSTGLVVEKDAILAVIDTVELSLNKRQLQAGLEDLAIQKRMAQINLQRTQVDIDYLQQRYQRTKKLVDQNSMPIQQLDDLTNQMEKAKSAQENARQSLHSLSAKEKQIAAQLKSIQKKMNDAVVHSPAAGIIASKYFEEGEAIPPLNPLVEIISLHRMDVKIYVSGKLLGQIQYGQTVKIKVDGIDEELNGSISWISPKAEFTPKTILTPETRSSLVYAVNVTVDNQDMILKHGMPVEVFL